MLAEYSFGLRCQTDRKKISLGAKIVRFLLLGKENNVGHTGDEVNKHENTIEAIQGLIAWSLDFAVHVQCLWGSRKSWEM